MRFFTALTIASSLISTAYGFCGSDAGPNDQRVEIEKKIKAATKNATVSDGKHPSNDAAFTVGVYWNVFYDQNNPSDGNIPWVILHQYHLFLNSP